MTEQRDPGESRRVALVRWCLRRWPLHRGRGLLLRLASPLLRQTPLVYRLEPGVLVQGQLLEHTFRYYFAYGLARDPSFRLARELVRRGDTIIDVGANVGFWLMGVARRAGPDARIHAFEPFPPNVDRLRGHLRRNGLSWVRCHAVAVGAKAGQATFLIPGEANQAVGSLAPAANATTLTVPVTTLDTVCQEQDLPRVDLIKVDVEGAELFVFQGARQLLELPKAPIIMFEGGDALASRFGTTTADAKTCLHSHGFDVFRFDGTRLRPVTLQEPHVSSEDLFALQPWHFRDRPLLWALLDHEPANAARMPSAS